MEQERDYQAVYIKDLFVAILRKWKAILVAILVGALLLGGSHFVTTLFSPEKLKKDMTGGELTQREQTDQALADTNMRIETQQAYLATSPLMSIDPNQFYQATLTLYIHTDYRIYPNTVYQDPDSMPSILAAYQQILNDGDIVTKIAEQTKIPGQYLDELVTCTPVVSHPGILNITINAADEQTATLLLELLTEVMEEASSNIEKYTAEHTLSAQSTAPILCADTAIADLQEAAYKRLTSLQDQKIAWQKQQTTLSISGTEADSLLVAAIGAVAGAVIMVIIIVIAHITSSKVYSTRTLKNRTGLKILGAVKAPGKLGFMQTRLSKLENRSIQPKQLQVITALLQNYCAKKQTIMLTSSCETIESHELIQALEEAKVPCTICNCLLTDPQALLQLPKCDAVILLEQCGRSRVPQVEQAIQIITDENVDLLGCILLGG